MDSLTQIVLGAACGEIALGKKIGNKALLFGAIGGTIPDLDVFIGSLFYSNSIDELIFHRGFMHSIVFAFLGAYVFGHGTYKLYNTQKRIGTTTPKDWIWLFFLSIFTHPLLDSFTPYGTQLFLPFSDYRVAFNTIAVVDPTYTIPFLISLIILMLFKRTSSKRSFWLKSGVYVSSAYLLFTIGNKIYIDRVFKNALSESKIDYQRYSAQPTIFNNILWYAIVETKEDYKVSFYSHFDTKKPKNSFISLPKNHELLPMKQNADLKKLSWFSNDFYNLQQVDSNRIRYNDLRYPLLNPEDKNSSVFSFEIKKNGNRWEAMPLYDKTPTKEDLQKFWNRVLGN
ncbi:metal-dependent hydrolase [uncultured Tenacibaculum sp.]|uniref:metal-dependent hydrolase n=1 Tax=uncultured Tenacibaculum sp. TaxID=174713 RepID=UPI002611676E|nr:metal-dependent hydrolase [uncultured Tenacibaculum sp.]